MELTMPTNLFSESIFQSHELGQKDKEEIQIEVCEGKFFYSRTRKEIANRINIEGYREDSGIRDIIKVLCVDDGIFTGSATDWFH